MLLAAPALLLAPLVVSLVRASPLAVASVLLAAMFVSLYVRPYGQRATELGTSVVMAIYFAWLFGATLVGAPGIDSALFWAFVIQPYHPQRYLMRGLHAFDASVADTVSVLAQQLASGAATGASPASLRRVHTARRVIESNLAPARPNPCTRSRRQARTWTYSCA